MLDFNLAEILLLVAFGVIIFGPEKLPDLARKAGRVLNYLRTIANDAQGRLREELGPEFADLELADLNPRALVNKHLLSPVQAELEPVKAELEPLKAGLEPAATMAGAGGQYRPDPVREPPRPDLVAFDTEAT